MFRSLVAILSLLMLIGCGEKQDKRIENGSEEKRPNAIMDGLRLTSTVRGKKGWEFFAEKAELFHEQKLIEAEIIKVYYYRDEKVVSTLTSLRCRLNTDTNDTYASGRVKLITKNGEILYTEELRWLAKTEKIYSDKPVTVIRGNNVIYAEGMYSDTNLEKIKFKGDVRMEIKDVEKVKELRD